MFLTLLFSLGLDAQAVSYANFLNISQLSAASSRIVDGKVQRIEPRMENGRIISRVYLDVNKTWAGPRNSEIYVDVLGGTLDGITMTVSGAPTFHSGENVLLFLDHHQLVGFGQGAYTIDGNMARRIVSEGLPEAGSSLDATVTLPDEDKARSCLETSVWSDYDDDWALRMMDTSHLSPEEFQTYPITILAGTEYQIQACNDGLAKDIHLQIMDMEAQLIVEDEERNKQAELFYKSTVNQTIYLVVSASEYEERAAQTGFSVSISYR